MPWESLGGRSVGAWWGGREGYRLDADLLWTPFLAAPRHLGPRTIAHFYLWDTEFKGLDTDEGMAAALARLAKHGVRYVVQTDLSAWYFQPVEIRRAVVRRNFRNLDLILQHGMVPLLNWNTIFDDDFDYYATVLPPTPYTLSFDLQHQGPSNKRGTTYAEAQWIHREARALSQLLRHYTFDRVLLVTGRRELKRYEQDFLFTPLRKAGIPITVIPTEMTKLRLKHMRYYQTPTAPMKP